MLGIVLLYVDFFGFLGRKWPVQITNLLLRIGSLQHLPWRKSADGGLSESALAGSCSQEHRSFKAFAAVPRAAGDKISW